MSFLTKSIAKRVLFTSSSPKKCRFLLQTLTSIQQSSSRFATTTTSRRGRPRIPRPQEPVLHSYVLTPPRVEINEAKKVSSWPKPSEIPYQEKVSNFINVVGFVQTPVQFEASLNGKYCAVTVIAHENNGGNSVFMIPVVFEGDLAHVVACHVKQNDSVFVSGKFSFDALPCKIIDEYPGNFHIKAETVNFVQGLKQSAKGKEDLVFPKNKTSLLCDDDDDDDEKQHSCVLEEQKDGASIAFNDSLSGKENVDSANFGQTKIKGGVTGSDDWRDLVKNPKQWWDYRKAKLDGTVKARHPDFKNKDNATSLWIQGAPRWVLEGLEGLGLDVNTPKLKGVNYGKEVDSWKDLLENPDKWWDNRATKTSQKAPDFKRKDTGIALWLNTAPDWVLSRLQPLRDQQAVSPIGTKQGKQGC